MQGPPSLLRRALLSVLGFCLAGCATGTAAVITVLPGGGGDEPTIQAAFAVAAAGDVIELGDGIFTGPGNADFFQWLAFPAPGDTVTLRSASGDPETCVVDGAGAGASFALDGRVTVIIANVQFRGLEFATGDMGPSPNPHVELRASGLLFRDCVVSLLLATDGRFVDVRFVGTGVFTAYQASFTGCQFADHHSAGSGGAILAWGGLTIADCFFTGNHADLGGGAICQTGDWSDADVHISDSVFMGNSAGESGGAIAMTRGLNHPAATLTVTGCTFYGNDAPAGSSVAAGGAVLMERCLVVAGLGGAPLVCTDEGAFDLACCDLFDNAGGDWVGCVAAQQGVAGNVATDPCFCAPGVGNLTLCADSWCLPGLPPAGCPGLWGARGAGCRSCSCEAPVPPVRRGWGDVRALYR